MPSARYIELSSASLLTSATTARLSFFFFQAEDGIRDLTVTGVQTCALPISLAHRLSGARGSDAEAADQPRQLLGDRGQLRSRPSDLLRRGAGLLGGRGDLLEIGRASCRERV